MSWLRRILRRTCEHDYETTDFWWLDDETCVRMETCSRCPEWQLTPVTEIQGEHE